MAAHRIYGIGETVLDIVFKEGQPQAAVPGGSTFNAMISVGRTVGVRYPDTQIIMMTQVGTDYVADLVTSFMEKNHVSSEGVMRIPGAQSTLSLALLDENNDAHYEFYRDKRASEFKAGEVEFHAGDIVVFGSFFAISPTTREQTRCLIQQARAAGAIIYYDINFRKSHMLDLPLTKQAIEENCAMSDIVRGSSEDIENVYGSTDAAYLYAEHLSKLCPNFICTKGAKEVEVFSPGVHEVFDVPKIDTVSTIGAGDNFNAGVVYS
ncbi:MAG: PfkB family carbohydrate kinase, partial [Bacteroidales bacterium]|nr:PfkB family carbohydrate kinase [Bacteroidales bacterium]